MRIEKKEKVKEKARGKALEIQEEVKITQGEESLILEKGDRIQVVKESIDPDLQKVVDIANSTEGIFGLQKPLERVFGKGNATFYNSSVLMVKTRRGRKIMIASPSNVELDGTEIPVQDGKLYVGYAD